MTQEMQPNSVDLMTKVTSDNFNEADYLTANPDVSAAVIREDLISGRQHFELFGHTEGRLQPVTTGPEFQTIKAAKMSRVEQLLDLERPHTRLDGTVDFLTDELREQFRIAQVDAISSHGYDHDVTNVITATCDGLVLDCGAGSRPVYYENVVNYEIVNYASTDVVGVAESLPFLDESFDAVISLQVLEHVKDPFLSARELLRVLKPGGTLVVAVPFLQPLHGYPHHYYNMTATGVQNLFEAQLSDSRQFVMTAGLPIFSLTWILRSWMEGLPPAAAERFTNLRVGDLIGDPQFYVEEDFVRELPIEKNFELAAGTMLIGTKHSSDLRNV